MRRARPVLEIAAVVLLAGLLPMLASFAADWFFTEAAHVDVGLHEAIEIVGACVALGVATLLLLRAVQEQAPSYLLWIVAALVAMGLIDGIHAIAPLGIAWSWLRHGATLAGGVAFALVWFPVPTLALRHKRLFALAVAALAGAAALLILWRPDWWPLPWSEAIGAVPDYTPPVKVANIVGGCGFLAAAVFFLRRHLVAPHWDDLVFASHTLLFGTASLLFGFSKRWAADWWGWHGLRLLAYLVVIAAAYETVAALYHQVQRHARELELENAERRLAQTELARHRGQLEQLVDERTEALREADRRKNEFLAVLSHELRNPLAPIRNSLFILDRSAPGSEQAARARAVIDRQVRQLTRLVDDLLDITRISRNKIQLRRQRLELRELVRRALEDQHSLFDSSGVQLESELAPEPVVVDADAERLSQVVGNLLQNAAKFTPRAGRVRVSVAADRRTERAVITVSDTGIGMQPDVVGQLFQPFTQAESTLDRSQGGLGLGLALVKQLVAMHGGEVSAHSDGPGQGAVFTVRLPLEPPPAADTAETTDARAIAR